MVWACMDPLFLFLIVLLFMLGAVVGSFLNVVIYRLPRGESISHPRSHCPRCGLTLAAADLVPMLSWVLLRGRCRSCGIRISPRYFAIELLTALLFVSAYLSHSFTSNSPDLVWAMSTLIHNLVLIALFVPMIFIDQELKIVPDELSAPLFVIGLLWNVASGVTGHEWMVTLATHGSDNLFDLSLPTSLVFATICAGIFWLIQWFGEIAFRKEAMGLGDVNIAAGIGANFPLIHALCSFGIAIGVGAIVGVFLIVIRKREKTDQLAFGPMLLAGALFMMLAPHPIEQGIQAYRSRLSPVSAVSAVPRDRDATSSLPSSNEIRGGVPSSLST